MLEQIKSICDLQKLDIKQLPTLCQEIRDKLVEEVPITGGHLASNLGVVELSVALHYVFGEDDKIVWDVGHQCYVHKILTNRGENFLSLRSENGISGFPDTTESDQDAFGTGHAGTAISAAMGLAKARDQLGQNHKVVAVVGDGSMTNGMVFEALNNIKDTNMLIILNDNNMSIGKNVGSATRNMSKLRVGKYDKNKEGLKKFLLKVPLVGKPIYKFLKWCKRKIKMGHALNSYFDNFDLKYVGIVDGHDIKDLVYYLTKIRDNVTKPTLLHIATKKGKGYIPAEQDAESFHSVPRNGAKLTKESATVVGETLCELAQENNFIVAISAAMTKAVGLADFASQYPERFFDVGIAEEHAVTFAAGLAKGGIRPFVAIYSTFLQRSYDQILHDVAIQNLPVTFLIDRAGFVGDDGKTHQGLFDLSYLSTIPNVTVWTPCTYLQLRQMIKQSLIVNGPVCIRYSRTLLEDSLSFANNWNSLSIVDNNTYVFAVGARCVEIAKQVCDRANVYAVTQIKPMDFALLDNLPVGAQIVTMEENVCIGGFGQQLKAYLASTNKKATVKTLAVDDKFVSHASVDAQMQKNNITLDYLLDILQ